jgi:hypothetical protein
MEVSGQYCSMGALVIPGWVGPRAKLDVVANRKIPAHIGKQTPVIYAH